MQKGRVFTDMMNRLVEIPFPPCRIISVVPSQTELLYDLGLDEEVIGITKFCIHPADWFRTKARVGGTKKLNLNLIMKMQPDLIIANKEENTEADIKFLAQHFPVWISDIQSFEDSITMMRHLSEIVDKKKTGREVVYKITRGFSLLKKNAKPLRVAYFIWRNPWMVVGKNTFIDDVMSKLGWHNVYGDQDRYPETYVEQLRILNPEIILLSSEPYPFKEKHINELKKIVPHAKIILVDGEMFSWYGSRMKLAPAYLEKLLLSLN